LDRIAVYSRDGVSGRTPGGERFPASGGLLRLSGCALLLVLTPLVGFSQQGRFVDEIRVSRALVEARVVDAASRPVTDLRSDEFSVTIGGVDAKVEDAEWVGSSSVAVGPGEAARHVMVRSDETPASIKPRVLVILVQLDLESVRLTGLYRISGLAEQLLRKVTADDRVAVATFGAHLQLNLDLTSDLEAVRRELAVTRLLEAHQVSCEDETTTLACLLDGEQARNAADLRQALVVLGRALAQLDGPKQVLLLGWGVGRYVPGGVSLGTSFTAAIESLARARTSVHCLDITAADYHTLEVGLQQLTADTGGVYLKTNLFPQQAVTKVAEVLSGAYEITVLPPPRQSGLCELKVKVTRRGVSVLAPAMIDLGSRTP